MNKADELSRYLPLTESTYYILISLTEPLHGYGIMQKTESISKGQVKIGPGTLYGAINKLLKEGLIERVKEQDEKEDRKKSYILTALGKKLVLLEYNRLKCLVEYSKEFVDVMEDSI